MERDIVVWWSGHWSTRGKLEEQIEFWNFGLEIGGKRISDKDREDSHPDRVGSFYKEIKPYLPDDYETRMVPPEGSPGPSGWSLDIPLKDFKDPETVKGILNEYFSDPFQE